MATVPPTLQPIIGAGLIGVLLAAPLFGVYSVQMYSYFIKYPNDKLWMKSLVYFLWIILAAQYAVNIHSVYVYLIKDFGQPAKLGMANPDFIAYVIFDSIAAVVVQCFFARRLYLFIQRPVLRWLCVIPIVIFSWLGLVSGFSLFARGVELEFFSKFRPTTWLSDLWLGSNVACDTIITICMCCTLHTHRRGIKKTDRLINKLIAYSIQTGATTSFTEIFCLATVTTSGFHFGHILVIFPLAGLYCNSFLTNLHARVPNDSRGPGLVSVPMEFTPPADSFNTVSSYVLSDEDHKTLDDVEMARSHG